MEVIVERCKFCALLFVFLCFLGCGDEGWYINNEVAPPAPATIGAVPPHVAESLWGDLHALVDELSLLLREDDKLGDEFHGARWQSMVKRIALILSQQEYYTKYINAGGVAIVGGRDVDDRFFYAAREIVLSMTSKRPEVRAFLTHNYGFRMILFNSEWGIASIPEVILVRPLRPVSGSCVIDDFLLDNYCVASFPFPNDHPLFGNTFVHEFAHAMHTVIQRLDATFQERLETAYANAVEFGGYWQAGHYGYTDVLEYWAVGVTTWFDTVGHPKSSDILGPQFLAKDPLLYALLEEWFPVMPVLHIPDQESCIAHLERIRWRGTLVCPL